MCGYILFHTQLHFYNWWGVTCNEGVRNITASFGTNSSINKWSPSSVREHKARRVAANISHQAGLDDLRFTNELGDRQADSPLLCTITLRRFQWMRKCRVSCFSQTTRRTNMKLESNSRGFSLPLCFTLTEEKRVSRLGAQCSILKIIIRSANCDSEKHSEKLPRTKTRAKLSLNAGAVLGVGSENPTTCAHTRAMWENTLGLYGCVRRWRHTSV